MKIDHEVILCIVNAGYSDTVMETARKYGAGGGTVLRARGTADSAAEKLFNISIHPEKEIVMILVSSELRDNILHGLYRAIGLDTPGQGIAFSLPVDKVVGISERKGK